MTGSRFGETHDCARKRGFAATGLTNNAQCLAAPDMQRDSINRCNRADLTRKENPLSDRKFDVKLSDIQKRFTGSELAPGNHVGAANRERMASSPAL
jgi:hypothetical protein